MPQVTLELSDAAYEQARDIAQRTGKRFEDILSEWVNRLADDGNMLLLHTAYEQVKKEVATFNVFAEAVAAIDWRSKPPNALKIAVDMALSLDAVQLARELSQLGTQIHPGNDELLRIAKVIAPPKIVKTDRPPKPSLSATMQWLRDHAHEYRGLWIAVQAGNLLTTATSHGMLIEKLANVADKDILITQVGE